MAFHGGWINFLASFYGPSGPSLVYLLLQLGYSLSWPNLFLVHVVVILVSFKVPKHVKLFPSPRPLHILMLSAGMLFELLVPSHFSVSLEKTSPMMLSRLPSFPAPHPYSVPKYSLALCSSASHKV